MASSSSQLWPAPLVRVMTRPHLVVTVLRCTLWTFNPSRSFANLRLVLDYNGMATEVTQMSRRQQEHIHYVEAIFNFCTQFALLQPNPGEILVTVQNGSGQFLASCWIDPCQILSYQLQNCRYIVSRSNGEAAGFVDFTFELRNVTFHENYEAHHAQELQIAQETDPAANPSSATSAPEMARSAPTSSAPFSSPTAPPRTAQSSVSITFGSLTAPQSAADSVAQLSSLIAADVLQSTTAQSSSLTAAPLAADVVQSSTAQSSSLTAAPLAADVVQSSSLTAESLAADLGQSTAAQPSTYCTHGSSTAPASAED